MHQLFLEVTEDFVIIAVSEVFLLIQVMKHHLWRIHLHLYQQLKTLVFESSLCLYCPLKSSLAVKISQHNCCFS